MEIIAPYSHDIPSLKHTSEKIIHFLRSVMPTLDPSFSQSCPEAVPKSHLQSSLTLCCSALSGSFMLPYVMEQKGFICGVQEEGLLHQQTGDLISLPSPCFGDLSLSGILE